MESIFLSDLDYERIASQTEDLVKKLDELPYPKVKDDMHLLLQNFDLLHREALTRLFKEIIINHSDLHTRMQQDKAIHLLFSLYDLFKTDLQNGTLIPEDIAWEDENKYPRWIPVGNVNKLKDNTAYKYAEDGENILICKSEGKVFAVKNSCGNTSLPLDGATIDQGYLICPWHGCVYRLSDGVMESNPSIQLKKYPITIIEDGELRIGLNMQSHDK